ncbi:DUF3274 domain-containing protein [Herbaspirillum sp. RV1423]|uniref:T6SS effector phospholipase Tle3 domain-containing protein n=1 Tax=Herbaspirillum sp. RV1423 TaxID=1443993 RepID=UPI0004B4A264|nr:DUF3274 domain-containing protein [Herbaspirillum sp. RV1423]
MAVVNYPIETNCFDGKPAKSDYQHPDAMNPCERTMDTFGNFNWKSYETPESYQVWARADLPISMPGIVIFVHGVNSEGEWYDAAEDALCQGLNERLNRDDLKTNKYLTQDPKTEEPIRRKLDPDNDGRSPVIRFYWGYRAQDSEKGKWRIPLKNPDQLDYATHGHDNNPEMENLWYWGGGPFQNGTNNLQQLWDKKGFSRHVLGFDMQHLNTEVERQLNDAPPREYFAHAAQRLANLIDTIREQSLNSLTLLSHSQGTMIALAATLLCKKRPPDAVMLMNSPYALTDKFTDTVAIGNDRPTDGARLRTLQAVVDKLRPNKQFFNKKRLDCLRVGATKCGQMHFWKPDIVHPCGTPERDNHGRLYNYFNPHDRVMGSTPLQSIGWQSIPGGALFGMQDVVKQRMMARGMPCGDEPALTPFGTLPEISDPEPGVLPSDFWNKNKTIAVFAKLWAEPPKDQMVSINAEKVPNPLTAEEMSRVVETKKIYRDGKEVSVDVYFDQSLQTADSWGAINPETGKYREPDFPYHTSIYRREAWIDRDDVYSPGGKKRELETQEEMQQRITNWYPMPTNHSTMPMHVEFMKRVVAYDLPIGYAESYNREHWSRLIHLADWTSFEDRYFSKGEMIVPPKPAGLDPETVSEQIRKADEERIKSNKTYGGA